MVSSGFCEVSLALDGLRENETVNGEGLEGKRVVGFWIREERQEC